LALKRLAGPTTHDANMTTIDVTSQGIVNFILDVFGPNTNSRIREEIEK
jgi:hypothetical protein